MFNFLFWKVLFVIIFTLAHEVHAEERPVVFTDDPIVLGGEEMHTLVEIGEIYFDVGECVIIPYYVDGATESYTTDGGTFNKIKISESGALITLEDLLTLAAKICWPDDTIAGGPTLGPPPNHNPVISLRYAGFFYS